jgi:signal peptidase II
MRVVRPQGLTAQGAIGFGIAGGVVLADFLTKRWAESTLPGKVIVLIPGVLSLVFEENSGAAFSLFQNAGLVLGTAAMAAIVVVGVALFRRRRPPLEVAAFGLIIGGAAGNLIDRILRGPGLLDGKVVDWVQLLIIPTFNVADSAITVAITLLLIGSFRRR